MSSSFLRIRHKFLKERKYVQFIVVAFAEVFLIVFGILLALEIDNWNDKRNSEKKIESLLAEIRLNLSEEIVEAERTIKILIQRDSIIQKVIDRTVTRQDFASPTLLGSPQYALVYYQTFDANKNPYENLIQISDEIPARYTHIYKDMNTLYEEGVTYIQARTEKLLDKLYPFQDDMRRSKTWWSDLMGGKELDDEAIDYFLYDPIYLNWAYEIGDDLDHLRRSILWYKNLATEIVDQLNDLGVE